MGHAVFVTLQDILIRYHRMLGFKTLWLPGADHAGFETQVVYDKKLEKEGRSRFEIPADKLYQEILNFTLINKKNMENQLRKLGASCDWSREKFTLDEDIIKIVYETFEKLERDGLIYKGERIVNWCVKHQTSLSDLEIKYEPKTDPLYFIKYGPLEVATVRPETRFGDTALAVNPSDKRYQKYIGKVIDIDTGLKKSKIKVIADEAVDPRFGTGVVKVTPAHDPVDFEIWQRHKSEMPPAIQVIDKFGKMNEFAGPFKGLKVNEARKQICDVLIKKGLIDPKKTDYHYQHNVALCYKCGTIIEPIILKNQYFIKMNEKPKSGKLSLKDMAIKAVKTNEIKFYPKRFKKIFLNWMQNLRDWNISRQIPWGIKIPKNDTRDVFDTWFSSAQWPFATLLSLSRSNKKLKDDFKNYYPTSVMETAWDILFFWVARMIMLGVYVTKKIPFKKVVLHGLVKDAQGQKMSKSRGNVIDPIEMTNKYGADAVRASLVLNTALGSDQSVSEQKIKAARNFVNKVWNIARFLNFKGIKISNELNLEKTKLALIDKWILTLYYEMFDKVKKDLNNFRFNLALERIYNFLWHELADWYIEISKSEFSKARPEVLGYVFTGAIKLLHPFLPFVTEKIWSEIGGDQLLMIKQIIPPKKEFIFTKAKQDFEKIKNKIILERKVNQSKSIKTIFDDLFKNS
jgi:valyl-tRNA synthetase